MIIIYIHAYIYMYIISKINLISKFQNQLVQSLALIIENLKQLRNKNYKSN